MQIRRIIAAGAAVTLASTGLVACGSGDDSDIIRVGTTDAAKKAWSAFEDAAKEKGYKVEIVPFSDYTTPNQALEQGKLDTNNFQHLQYLAEYNKGNDTDLVPIVSTEIVPLALFWKDHDSLDGIDGEEIAIPNDTTNQARAINLLKQKGLVELKPDAPLSPQPNDIDKDKSKVKVAPVGAEQTSSAYSEGKPAVINNSFLDRAGIDPHSAVAQDDPKCKEAEPYINVFAVRSEDADNQELKDLAALWHSDEVQKAVEEDSAGTSIPVDRSAEELQDILKRLEEETDGADANASK
ncbi:MetQ/NlpA family ABC transporter substrate-binding protein [Corynebacterium massiliense]|uniref:MetQ/NlpA family ABC transporter substrate-binding protein n=1 Tax=Corynebacterium massiliense TaxID=441501 RepID=UPI002356A788|nr:MetQ/NlpA family ABC transporter substrate-binding protein [Corynebacterium massiliense]